MMGLKTQRFQIANGTAKTESKTEIIGQLASTRTVFDPRFEILSGTKEPSPSQDLPPYELGPVELQGE